MSRRALTDGFVKGLAPGRGERIEIADTTRPGLILRGSWGAKSPRAVLSWSYRYSYGGKIDRITIGRYPGVKLSDARAAATRYRAALDAGRDPKRLVQVEQIAARGGVTFGELADRWLVKKAAKRSLAEDKRQLDMTGGPRGEFGDTPCADISKRDWLDYLDRFAKDTPIKCNRLQALVHSILAWGFSDDLIDANALAGVKRRGGVETKRKRVLDDAELRAVWRTLNNDKSKAGPILRAAIRFQIATCCRASEAAKLPRAEIQGLRSRTPIWVLPKARSKNGEENHLPLSALAADAINAADARTKTLRDKLGPWIFPARGFDDRPSERYAIRDALETIRTEAGVEHFTSHDLRRTGSSIMQRLGVQREIIDRCQTHKVPGMAGTYQVDAQLEAKRDAFDRLAAHIAAL